MPDYRKQDLVVAMLGQHRAIHRNNIGARHLMLFGHQGNADGGRNRWSPCHYDIGQNVQEQKPCDNVQEYPRLQNGVCHQI